VCGSFANDGKIAWMANNIWHGIGDLPVGIFCGWAAQSNTESHWMGCVMEKLVTCPLCNHTFNPMEHPGCANCPLKKGCMIICCPSCGYSFPHQDQSTLVKWSSHLLSVVRKDNKRK
jgi:hypothetical protein